MFETQTVQTRIDETARCREKVWISIEDEKPVLSDAIPAGLDRPELEASNGHFDGMIKIGHKVFLTDGQLIGLATKLFLNPGGHISYLAVRTARLLGSHKMVPVSAISEVDPLRVTLAMNAEQFKELPGYQSDSSLAEDVDRALWKDVVLRNTDYHQIDVQVRDGIVIANGHVLTSMNQWRAETAVKTIPGILGVKSYLIPDDKLLLEVAEALGKFEQGQDTWFFPKVENGFVVLAGEVGSSSIRDQAERCVAEIPWVRGILNEIHAPGIELDPRDQRLLQPLVGKELLFKDSLLVKTRKVIINPNNRRVVAMVVLGRFPDPKNQSLKSSYASENSFERELVLPIDLVDSLSRSTGYLNINSDEIGENVDFNPTLYVSPGSDWLPPYPYCTADVLFAVE